MLPRDSPISEHSVPHSVVRCRDERDRAGNISASRIDREPTLKIGVMLRQQ